MGMRTAFKRLVDWMVYVLVRTFVCLIQSQRLETCHRICRFLAWVAADMLRVRRRVVDENLQHAFPHWTTEERRLVARRMWEHLLLMVCEVAHAPRILRESTYRRFVTFRGRPEMLRLLLDGRPTVLVTGHFGNFELAGYIAGLFGFPSVTIARPLDNPYLHRWITRFRQMKGQYLLPKDGVAGTVDTLLQRGATLSLLADQAAGDKGCWIEFMGRPASCHKGVALFALSSGAPLLVCYLKRTGRPMHFELGVAGVADPESLAEELAGVKPLAQWYHDCLADLIREAPEQYWWVHRRWKGQPRSRRRRASAA